MSVMKKVFFPKFLSRAWWVLVKTLLAPDYNIHHTWVYYKISNRLLDYYRGKQYDSMKILSKKACIFQAVKVTKILTDKLFSS